MFPGLAAASVINIVDQEVSLGVNDTIGWAEEVVQDSGLTTSDGVQPVFLQTGAEARVLEFRTFGPQFAKVDINSSGSLAYNLQTGTAPSFFGTTSTSIMAEAVGSLAIAQGQATTMDNYAYFEFEVFNGPAEFALSFNETAESGFLRLTGDNSTFIALGTDGDRAGTLEEGRYRVEAFYSLTFTTGMPEGVTQEIDGGVQFAMTFPGSTIIPLIPAPPTVAVVACLGAASIRRRR